MLKSKLVIVLGFLVTIFTLVLFLNPSFIAENKKPADKKEAKMVPQKEQVVVTAPANGQKVMSPLAVEGKAMGGWYFEGAFGIKLLDSKGNVLTTVQAKAQSDWMTADYVPFKATLTFKKPLGTTGKLVLQKSNPSGLAEKDASIEIPVNF